MRTLALLFLLLPLWPCRAETTPAEAVTGFFRAYAAGDADAAMSGWAESRFTTRLRGELRQLFRARCVEVSSLEMLSSVQDGETARVEALIALTSSPREHGRITAAWQRHTFDLRRDGGVWRMVMWRTAEDDLVQRMERAPDDAAAEAVLLASPELLDEPLIDALVLEYDRAANDRRRKDALFVNRWITRVAARIGTPAAWAAAIPIAVESEHGPGADREALRVRLRTAIAFAEEAGAYDSLAYALNMLGVFYMDDDESSVEAEECFARILSFRGSLVRMRNIELALQNEGGLLFARQDYRGAYVRFVDALQFSSALEHKPAMAFCELYIGRIHERQNDPELAALHYARGLLDDPVPVNEIMLRLGLASSRRRLGQVREADAELETALSLAKGKFDGLTALALVEKAQVSVTAGKLDAALVQAEEAVAAARRGHYPPGEFDGLLTVAFVQYRAGQLDAALRALAAVDELSERADFAGNERYLSRVLAGRVHARAGHPDEAIAAYRQAIARIEETRLELAGSERESRLFFEPYETAYNELVALLAARGQDAAALRIAEQAKARVLLSTLGRRPHDLDALLPPSARQERQRRLAVVTQASRQLLAARAAAHPDNARLAALAGQLRAARTSLDDLQADLTTRYPRYGRDQVEVPIVTAADLARLVAEPGLALVEYVVQNDATYAFVIAAGANGKARITVRTIPVSRRELERLVDQYAARIAKRDLDIGPLSRRLYEMLLAPLDTRLGSRSVIGIVPDGILWRLPFAALTAADGRFLIERRAIFYIPSISVYRQLTLRPRSTRQRVAAFGDPALPDAAREVRTIAAAYGSRGEAFLGSSATEERVTSVMTRARIVHFATHGVFDDGDPMYSRLVLSDGVLEAWELMTLDLDADLVVLSGCETARGRISAGEGLVGLSWALFVAGCPSTVGTQWQVRSRATAEAMVAFHRRLAGSGMQPFAKARALRQTQRELLQQSDSRHPFYWAAFVVVGRP